MSKAIWPRSFPQLPREDGQAIRLHEPDEARPPQRSDGIRLRGSALGPATQLRRATVFNNSRREAILHRTHFGSMQATRTHRHLTNKCRTDHELWLTECQPFVLRSEVHPAYRSHE